MGAAKRAQPAIASRKQAARTPMYPSVVRSRNRRRTESDPRLAMGAVPAVLFGQSLFNFVRFPCQRRAQDPGALVSDENNVLDANANALFRNVNAGLHR